MIFPVPRAAFIVVPSSDRLPLRTPSPSPPSTHHSQTVVSGIEDLGREAGVSLRESSVKPQFEALVSASDALKTGLARAKTNKPDIAQVRRPVVWRSV